jgi:hypothetical protein
MSMKTVFAAMVTFTIVALGAACGGDGDTLSREELIEQADALCTEYNSRGDEVEELNRRARTTSHAGWTRSSRSFRKEATGSTR